MSDRGGSASASSCSLSRHRQIRTWGSTRHEGFVKQVTLAGWGFPGGIAIPGALSTALPRPKELFMGLIQKMDVPRASNYAIVKFLSTVSHPHTGGQMNPKEVLEYAEK